MEHFKSPFQASDFVSERSIEGRRFMGGVLAQAENHRYFRHPFLTDLDAATATPEFVTFVLTSTYQLVTPFTAMLCALGGQTPNLRSRFALMDNIYEEMGCGDFEAAHPTLYLKMLASIGVTEEDAEALPLLPAIRRINDHLRDVVLGRHFSVACAMLALAEAVIPPTFPVFMALAQSAFPRVDMTFFDRHGPRDAGHSDDAAMLFAINADRAQFGAVEAEVKYALDLRSELFDDWMLAATSTLVTGDVERTRSLGQRPLRSHSERPPRPRPLSERPRALSDRPPRSRPLSERPSPLSDPLSAFLLGARRPT